MTTGYTCHIRIWIPEAVHKRQEVKEILSKLTMLILTQENPAGEMIAEVEEIAFGRRTPKWAAKEKTPKPRSHHKKANIRKLEKSQVKQYQFVDVAVKSQSKTRKCITCEQEFFSENYGHRMCRQCRRESPSPFDPL